MTTEPRVSIIIRTFNRPKMLKRALESVGRQTYKNLEAVVINDGGDDVQGMVDEFKAQFDVIYLNFPHEQKPGRCKAANEGIAQSTGEWICYLELNFAMTRQKNREQYSIFGSLVSEHLFFF